MVTNGTVINGDYIMVINGDEWWLYTWWPMVIIWWFNGNSLMMFLVVMIYLMIVWWIKGSPEVIYIYIYYILEFQWNFTVLFGSRFSWGLGPEVPGASLHRHRGLCQQRDRQRLRLSQCREHVDHRGAGLTWPFLAPGKESKESRDDSPRVFESW